MNTNILLGVVALIIVIGGGWWYYSSMQPVSPTGDAAGTMLEGSEMPDNGMVGGDAAMPVPGSGTEEMVAIREFTVIGDNFSFSPAKMEVKKGDTVRITFRNNVGTHDWVLDEFPGARTKVIGTGAEETVEFIADKAGTFEYYCSVGKHRAMGMKGSFVVTE